MTRKDPHVALLQAEIRRLQNEAPVGLSRIYASFPQLRPLISTLAWYVIAADPTASKVIDPDMPFITKERSHDGIVPLGKRRATHASAVSSADARDAMIWVNRQVKHLTRKLDERLNGRDPSMPSVEKPRCGKRNCPEPWRRQPFGTKTCAYCGQVMAGGRVTERTG